MNFYNEHDSFAAAWLRNLIADGLIAPGIVSEEDIRDLKPDDLRGFTQCHFFAGISGWSLAARLAGWDDRRPLWTGSCPCQPFSSAGRGDGIDDERHLWPAFFNLIKACRPPVIFGEQVASSAVIGSAAKIKRAIRRDGGDAAEEPARPWLEIVFDDLESAHYACGAVVLPACCVGAPHIRQRTWFVADASIQQSGERHDAAMLWGRQGHAQQAWMGGGTGELADTNGRGARRGIFGPGEGHSAGAGAARERSEGLCASGELADTGRQGRREIGPHASRGGGGAQGLEQRPLHGRSGDLGNSTSEGPLSSTHPGIRSRQESPRSRDGEFERPSIRDPWRDVEWLSCRDGKQRPVKRGLFPLAAGLSGRMVVRRTVEQAGVQVEQEHWYSRVGVLKGAGNAIVPQLGAEVIRAFMECRP